jgi:hypothetical protein
MSIYKDNVTGKWRVVYRYTDWTGKTKQTSKRGFPTKREAQMWEHEQMLKHDAKLDMTFASFYEIVLVKLFCNTLFDKYLTVTSLHRC